MENSSVLQQYLYLLLIEFNNHTNKMCAVYPGPYTGFLKGGFADPQLWPRHKCGGKPLLNMATQPPYRERVQERGVPLPITAFHKFGEGIGNSAWFFVIFIFIIIV